MNATMETIAAVPSWDVEARRTDGSGPSLQARIDADFEHIVTPYMRSSGWVCTLTIECGTRVCACR
ncbi:MAG: hypothetical protein QG622_691 [Actinomycetota bacterium]|nr:hypothetical protein [Actinomycetota bacterium]